MDNRNLLYMKKFLSFFIHHEKQNSPEMKNSQIYNKYILDTIECNKQKIVWDYFCSLLPPTL